MFNSFAHYARIGSCVTFMFAMVTLLLIWATSVFANTNDISPEPKNSCPSIARVLNLGAAGAEVTSLQTYLSKTGDYTYPEITGYFGTMTEQAVQVYQKRNNIVSSGAPETTGYGVVGLKTRTHLLDCLKDVTTTAPTSESLSVTTPLSLTGAQHVGGVSSEALKSEIAIINAVPKTEYQAAVKVGTCGNGIWEIGESLTSCPQDCTMYCTPPPDDIAVVNTGKYKIGAYVMPGLNPREGIPYASPYSQKRFEFIWNLVTKNKPWVAGADDQPQMPIMNAHDETNPIVVDWWIKWGLEHGVSLFVWDLFWIDGEPAFDNMKSLEEGFMKSKYLKYPVNFTVMWTNSFQNNEDNLQEYRTGMIHYAMKYFKHPNYLKINGKPVFYVFRPDNLPATKYVRTASDPNYGNDEPVQIINRKFITDLVVNDTYGFTPSDSECVELNLGGIYPIDKIYVWHRKDKTFNDPRVLTSIDGKTWTTVFDGDAYKETAEGRIHTLPSVQKVRYVRDCIKGSDVLPTRNEWGEIKVFGTNTGGVYTNLAQHLAEKEQIQIKALLDMWEQVAIKNGFPGLYFVSTGGTFGFADLPQDKINGFDALTSYFYYPSPPDGVTLVSGAGKKPTKISYTTFDRITAQYKKTWLKHASQGMVYYPLVTTGFDNSLQHQDLTTANPQAVGINATDTPVQAGTAHVITNPSPLKFESMLKEAKKFLDPKKGQQIIMVKAWNEWPESSSLVPTKKWGFGYLDAIKKVFEVK